MFYGCHRAQKQQEHAHTDQTVLLSLFFGMRRAYYHANEQTRALVNHCVFTVRTSAVGAEGGRKRCGENRARPKHRPVQINISSLWRGRVVFTLPACSIHYNPLSSTGNHCTFILISSTRNKSNLKAVFQPWAGKKNPFSFQKEQSNIYVQLAAVSRALTSVSHLKVTTNKQCGHR